MKLNFKIILFAVFPIIYLIFRQKLVDEWNSIESFIAVLSYFTSIVFYTYITDIKFYFWVSRQISVFKYAHTTWSFSANFFSEKEPKVIIQQIEKQLGKNGNQIKVITDTAIEIFINNSFLVNISVQHDLDCNIVFLNTSKIIVPTKETNNKSIYISELIESIEKAVIPVHTKVGEYSIDIEYSDKSPYYSYWVKKLPEEMIYNFNCNIKIPNTTDSTVKVNKNHIIIKSKSHSKIFQLTRDYVSLQAMI